MMSDAEREAWRLAGIVWTPITVDGIAALAAARLAPEDGKGTMPRDLHEEDGDEDDDDLDEDEDDEDDDDDPDNELE